MREAVLVYLAVTAAVVGVWAAFVSASFADDFGLTQAWVAIDGPFNEHLVRDVGQLNLALAVITAGAARFRDGRLDRLVGLAWLATGVPHLVYHAAHLGPFTVVDAVAQVLALATSVVLPLVLVLRRRQPKVPG